MKKRVVQIALTALTLLPAVQLYFLTHETVYRSQQMATVLTLLEQSNSAAIVQWLVTEKSVSGAAMAVLILNFSMGILAPGLWYFIWKRPRPCTQASFCQQRMKLEDHPLIPKE